MSLFYAILLGSMLGNAGGQVLGHFLCLHWLPRFAHWRQQRRTRRDLGGLPDLRIESAGTYPAPEDRRAFGQMMAYMVELGELGPTIQGEAHDVVRAKVRDEEYTLTPETARYVILMSAIQKPDRDVVWELVDEACDMLGEEHPARD